MQDTFALNGFLPHFICIFDRETRFRRDAGTPTPRFPPNQYRRFRLFTSLLSAVVSRQCCNSEVFLGNVKWCYQFRCSVEITFVTLLYADLWSWGSSLHCYYWSLVLVREPIRLFRSYLVWRWACVFKKAFSLHISLEKLQRRIILLCYGIGSVCFHSS